jgi:hypothetical protein
MGFKPTPKFKKTTCFVKHFVMINKHKETLKLMVQITLQKLNFHFAHKKSRIHNLLPCIVHRELQFSTFQNKEHKTYFGFFCFLTKWCHVIDFQYKSFDHLPHLLRYLTKCIIHNCNSRSNTSTYVLISICTSGYQTSIVLHIKRMYITASPPVLSVSLWIIKLNVSV